MVPLQLIAIGIIALGTVLLGVDQRNKRDGKNKKHGDRGGAGNHASEPDRRNSGADGARRVGPTLKGAGKNVRLVPDALGVDSGNVAGDDSGGKPHAVARPDPEPPVNGNPETESGGAPEHQEGASGEPSPGPQKTRKKKKAVKDA